MARLVVVESPAKAKTINNYLGKDYYVIASYGHIRDLPNKQGAVAPDQSFQMMWELNDRGKKQLKAIKEQLKSCDEILLATDPDREGEAISWHIVQELSKLKSMKNMTMRRVVFNEITKSAITKAIETPRDIDQNLVSSYLARRALDYLMGFTLSPVLWRKLPGSRSAGRVQSVALRLISNREGEIEIFKPQEYWSFLGSFFSQSSIESKLIEYRAKKLDKLDIKNEAEANEILSTLNGKDFKVSDMQTKRVSRHPYAPFITSTLQQDASRKLGFSASKTMQMAQQLYEGVDIGGQTKALISYMRTDSTNLSSEALSLIRSHIQESYDAKYLPSAPRQYKTKSKNAQEAHEAIRPIDPNMTPASLKGKITSDLFRMYELIWKRAVASQMSSAELDQTRLDISDVEGLSVFRATGSIIKFKGFLALYDESSDEEKSDDGKILPQLENGQLVECKAITPEQHFTQPPPRYSEASLIKKMEELGIGRPSTYATIIKVLQDRSYVRLEKKRFFCEDRGRIVTTFLNNFFKQYVEYDFTAQMETKLDEIAAGNQLWEVLLKGFWDQLESDVKSVSALRIAEVIDLLNDELETYLFPSDEENVKSRRKCPECKDGVLSLKLGKFGSFIGCSNYPDCKHTRKLSEDASSEKGDAAEMELFEPKEIGNHPELNVPIFIKKGPYGFYVEMEDSATDAKGKKKTKQKRAAIPKTEEISAVDLAMAVQLLSLPRVLGDHPETGDEVVVNKGRFGPYVQYRKGFTSLPKNLSVYEVTLEEAVVVLATPKKQKTK